MFSTFKLKAQRTMLKTCLIILAGVVIEHAAGAYAIHTGLIQGHFVPPEISFGGFSEAKEEQLAMLGGALPATVMLPPGEKPARIASVAPLPGHKPVQK